MSVFVYGCGEKKSKSNYKIIDVFFNKSLNEMFLMLKSASGRFPWLNITEEQIEKMTGKLDRVVKDGKTYGELPYREFFDKTGD